jgi:tetratricopeptide (TPR) repeat protein
MNRQELKLKPISKGGIPEAISKAELYRYLNEPGEAESICRDILAIDSENQIALRLLGLALTDQFTGETSDRYAEAESVFEQLKNPYERLYYMGLLYERRAKAQLKVGRPPHMILVLFEKAMQLFEQAEKIRPEGNDDAILRWNRCVRILQSIGGLEAGQTMENFDTSDSPPAP